MLFFNQLNVWFAREVVVLTAQRTYWAIAIHRMV
jgi:hypothetical protein